MDSFDRYYAATEDAFTHEHDEFSRRVDEVREKWEELAKADVKTVQLVKELSQLKNLLRRGHLQVLRTKEESLHMKLRNAQLSFHVRQLQSEVKRFLPYTNIKTEPSTEYQLSIDKSEIIEKKDQSHIAADEQLTKEIDGLLEQWKQTTKMQEQVFNEEMELQKQDDAQFELFANDYKKQNEITHKELDKIHTEFLKKFLQQQRASESLFLAKQTTQNTLKSKINTLENEIKGLNQKLETKLNQSKEKMEKILESNKKNLQDSINRQESRNTSASIEATKIENQLLDDITYFHDSIKTIKRKQKRIDSKKDFDFEKANEIILKLEAEMNALYTAATSIENIPDLEHISLIKRVATAVDQHAKVARNAEDMELRVIHLNNMMKRLIYGVDPHAKDEEERDDR